MFVKTVTSIHHKKIKNYKNILFITKLLLNEITFFKNVLFTFDKILY